MTPDPLRSALGGPMPPQRQRRRHRMAAGVLAPLLVLATASCGSDGDDAAAPSDEGSPRCETSHHFLLAAGEELSAKDAFRVDTCGPVVTALTDHHDVVSVAGTPEILAFSSRGGSFLPLVVEGSSDYELPDGEAHLPTIHGPTGELAFVGTDDDRVHDLVWVVAPGQAPAEVLRVDFATVTTLDWNADGTLGVARRDPSGRTSWLVVSEGGVASEHDLGEIETGFVRALAGGDFAIGRLSTETGEAFAEQTIAYILRSDGTTAELPEGWGLLDDSPDGAALLVTDDRGGLGIVRTEDLGAVEILEVEVPHRVFDGTWVESG